jgi:hypothetical protein
MPNIGSFQVRPVEAETDPITFEIEGGFSSGGQTVEVKETFTVSSRIGVVPLAEWIEAARSGLDTAVDDGIVAMKNLLADVVIDEDRERVLEVAKRLRMNGDDLMPVVRGVWRALGERPTKEPSDSADGSSTTTPSSREPSSSEEPSGPMPAWWDSAVARRERAANPDFGKDMLTVQEHGKSLVGAASD